MSPDGSASPVMLLSNGFQTEYEIGFTNGLARAGISPLLITSDKTPTERLDPQVLTCNLRGSQSTTRSAVTKVANILRYVAAYLIKSRTSGVRWVHVIGLFSTASTVLSLLEAVGLRLVAPHFALTVHNLLPHDRHGTLNEWLYHLIYRLPDRLVVHTARAQRELMDRFGIPKSRIVVMEHGIDHLMPPSPASGHWLREKYGILAEQPIILFFGALAPYKGVDLLIEAFGQMLEDSPAVLVIAGRCRDAGLHARLTALLRPFIDIRRAYWFDGFVAEEDVQKYFHGSDLLVMPYRHIDQSGVIFMAMATGLPVVATDVGSLADYVPLTAGAVVCPGDAAALAQGMESMLARLPQVDRLATVQRAESFLWLNTVRPLVGLYSQEVKNG